MTCPYCDDSHSAFDPCPESIAALSTKPAPVAEPASAEPCEFCGGTGAGSGQHQFCDPCDGTGRKPWHSDKYRIAVEARIAAECDAESPASAADGLSADLLDPCPRCGSYSDQAFTANDMRAAIAAERADLERQRLEWTRITAELSTLRQQLAEADATRGMLLLTLGDIARAEANGQPWITLASIQQLARNAIAATKGEAK